MGDRAPGRRVPGAGVDGFGRSRVDQAFRVAMRSRRAPRAATTL
jgi:hypothetical protein